FPSDCRICGAPLENISRLPVCLKCIQAIQPISCATCGICGENITGAHSGAEICTACEEERPHFARAVAYGSYDGEMRELIHLLKYEQVLPAADMLGKLLAQAITKLPLNAGPVLIVPVPLHSLKKRQRGFNQAELIARAALKHGRISGVTLDARVL